MDDNAHWVMGKHPSEDDIRFFFYPLPRLVLEHPIDPKNYVDRQFAKGTPLTWRDDITGQLQAAFMAYLNQHAGARATAAGHCVSPIPHPCAVLARNMAIGWTG